MNEASFRYIHTWPAKPLVAVLAMIGATVFTFAIYSVEEAPVFIQIVLGLFALISLMVAMGAAIGTTVEVDADGNLAIIKMMAGFPFNRIRIQSGEIIKVELNRQMSAGSPKSSDMGSNPSTPRFRIDIVHEQGKVLVVANSGNLDTQANRLAEAMNCPMEKIGDWR